MQIEITKIYYDTRTLLAGTAFVVLIAVLFLRAVQVQAFIP